MKIRAWQPSDSPQIVGLVTTILEREFPGDQRAYPAEDLEHLAETYQGPADTFLVAEEDNRVIGTCGVKADAPRTAILRRLFVDPEYRGKGVGRSLLNEALAFCKKKGFREVIIRTSTGMRQAIQLCNSMGFQQDGKWSLGEVTLVRFRLKLT